ncbi:MAG TPA: histidine kinase [Chryseosolibacter sp.]
MKRQLMYLQFIAWISALGLFYVYLSARLGSNTYTLAIAFSSFTFFVTIVYGYAFVLHRVYYRKLNLPAYIALVIAFLAATLSARMAIELFVIGKLALEPTIFDLGPTHLFYDGFSTFCALVIGILLAAVLDSFARERERHELRQKQAEAELNLLKAQLHPHFIFNSLNNLYYDVYKQLPEVAERISMLSGAMRYFIDEAPKDRVLLRTELAFIRNYIELERVRLPYKMSVNLAINADENTIVPPMLLMPLVENIFKHGERHPDAKPTIVLTQSRENIVFTVTNKVGKSKGTPQRAGLGLRNLRERLELLYGHRYELVTSDNGATYTATVMIPIHEN